MMRVVCLPRQMFPAVLSQDSIYFSLYATAPVLPNVGYIASSFLHDIRRAGISPNINALDFVTFAFSVAAADKLIDRDLSEDGWTRQIQLTVAVHEPDLWTHMASRLEKMLKFLSGDYWNIVFIQDTTRISLGKTTQKQFGDCVTLLSGGMDSLIGAIDLVKSGFNPIFVSHKVRGNVRQQNQFANTISPNSLHLSWSSAIQLPKRQCDEESTRTRSIVFFAFAALASCLLDCDTNGRKNVVVAENGYISLNVAMNPSRVASLSTKTTHPIYMQMLQEVWDECGLGIKLNLPYRFKTKGEMLSECKSQSLVRQLVNDSTSCGRFAHYKMTQCGRCVPCLVRRAAYLQAMIPDATAYYFMNLKNAGGGSHPNDIGAMAMCCLKSHKPNFSAEISGSFTFATKEDRLSYVNVYKRGLAEVERFLHSQNVI